MADVDGGVNDLRYRRAQRRDRRRAGTTPAAVEIRPQQHTNAANQGLAMTHAALLSARELTVRYGSFLAVNRVDLLVSDGSKIGRALCRESVCRTVEISVVAV